MAYSYGCWTQAAGPHYGLAEHVGRDDSAPGGGAFMEGYVAPDMFMRPLGSTLNILEEAGPDVDARRGPRNGSDGGGDWVAQRLAEHGLRRADTMTW